MPVPDEGCYLLEVSVPRQVTIHAGALGAITLSPGVYAYVGSARRAMRSRLARHLAPHKVLRWHIDYLTVVAPVSAVAVFPCEVGECRLAHALRDSACTRAEVPGFGCSDCRCRSHLLWLGRRRLRDVMPQLPPGRLLRPSQILAPPAVAPAR